MNAVDYTVIAAYLAALLIFGFVLRKQSGERDYFLGGRSISWFPLTLSTMATQLSAISFVSAPAFVGLREGGGLKWLTYEFSLPLAMIVVMFVIAPALYKAGIVSIYQYLESRFGRVTRILISISFQLVRSFATGVMVYAMGLILEAVLGIPLWQSLIVVGLVTLIYSASGGMKAVVYGDAIQMVLIFAGLLLITGYALGVIGGFEAFLRDVDPERLIAVNFRSFGFNGDEFGFLPMLFGGFVLYASYYGCDQTQAQRILSARTLRDTRVLLLADSLLRFPLVLLYCLAGLIVGVVFAGDAQLAARIPADQPDYMMPIFILEFLPNGVIGLLLVAIMAAAMSSLSSAVNSLAAVTMEDIAVIRSGLISDSNEVIVARAVSIFWGLAILIMSFFAGDIAPTVIESINKVGSALYGPILCVFLLGMLTRRVSGVGASAGLLAGVFVNLYVSVAQPQVFWMWWNAIGFVVTAVTAAAITLAGFRTERGNSVGDSDLAADIRWRYVVALVGMFMLIVGVSTNIRHWFEWLIP